MKRNLVLTLTLIFSATILFAHHKQGIIGIVSKETIAPTGNADLTVTSGSSTFKIVGPCGWAKAAGINYIGANHKENNLRVFAANFQINELPTKTTTYTLVKANPNDKDPSHVHLSITQITGSKLFSYVTSNASGKLTLVIEGNKITVNLTGIILQPVILNEMQKMMYKSENIGDFAKLGTLSGTLTFYRK